MTSNLRFLPRPILFLFGLAFSARFICAAEPKPIDFARDIRPILSDNCFHCHGPDAKTREAKLRLDTKEGLFAERDDITPFKPGKLDDSDAWIRIVSSDKDEQMPPPDSNRKLKSEQIALIKRWIEQGTPFKEHWSFQTPQRAALPKLGNAWWPKNPIDHFIAAELEEKKLAPSPEAAKEILLRRASFDLIGLPPTPAEIDLFLADTAPNAYEKSVDRLLASPRYGEHMARYWLDVARYGDTHGLHLDNERSMWPYRDWVVRAFNDNLPFDQFTIEQLAGDLLPERRRASSSIATGFNRCNVTTSEGGSIDEELLFRYAVDRTDDDGERLDGADRRLRRLPRPQVRPDFAEGVLPALRLLQFRRRSGDGRQHPAHRRRCCKTDHARAAEAARPSSRRRSARAEARRRGGRAVDVHRSRHAGSSPAERRRSRTCGSMTRSRKARSRKHAGSSARLG